MHFGLLAVALIVAFVARVWYVTRRQKTAIFGGPCARTLIVLGSGGHTTEILRHLSKLDPKLYQPRLYVLADSDASSERKIAVVESNFKSLSETEFRVKRIPRSRDVGQSYVSSIFTTIYSVVACCPTVISFKPDLILCNGPGTCIPVCAIGFLMKVLFLSRTRIVFVESVCRVKSLSLSGKILLGFADKVLVQWPELHRRYPATEYFGRLL